MSASSLGPRTWRVAIVVFLAVFLGGMGLTSASALWSQETTTTTGVAVGHWETAGCAAGTGPLDVRVTETSNSPGNWSFDVEWPSEKDVAYTVTVTKVGSVGEIIGSITQRTTNGKSNVAFKVTENNEPATFVIRVTPDSGPWKGAPTTRTLVLTKNVGYKIC